ncbi:GntR family transcriptional regulator [Streptomyces luteireticuli]|uniref:GntR family transcriptional regulator n=1 Tax=Streptomyces luteireticuli TaxID=173858 RepID=UPI003555CE20
MAAREIDHRAPKPPYQQIAADLKKRISKGELEPGKPVPSEKELVELYGVARNTVRSALTLLRADGLVYTVPGRGTYVADRSAPAADE